MATNWLTTIDVAGGTANSTAARDGWDEHEQLLGLAGTAVPQLTSASTTSIAAGTADKRRHVEITGTTGISSFGAGATGEVRVLRFVSAGCVVNHSTAIVCPGAANITSEAGTRITVWKLATSNDWLVVDVWHPSVLAGVTVGLPPGHLTGLGLANDTTDAVNDIVIATGRCRSDDDAANLVLASSLIKRLDATWSAGTNQGGLDTGSKANSTTYHVFAISNGASTVDVLFSASLASPTMPGGYTKKRRIGSVTTDASGNIRLFTQRGDEFEFTNPALDVNTTAGTTAATSTLGSIPTGLALLARIAPTVIKSGGETRVYISALTQTDSAPSQSAAPLSSIGGGGDSNGFSAIMQVFTNASAQIRTRAIGASTTLRIATIGYTDRRGRDG